MSLHRCAADYSDPIICRRARYVIRQTSVCSATVTPAPPTEPRRGTCHTVREPTRILGCMQERDELSGLEWVQEMLSRPAMEQVLTAGALLSRTSMLPEDHIVRCCCGAICQWPPVKPAVVQEHDHSPVGAGSHDVSTCANVWHAPPP